MRSEKSHYTAIKENEKLRLGTLNNPIFYFVNNKGNAGLEYEYGKAFTDFLNVSLEVKTFENDDELFTELENNNIDIAASNLLFQYKRLEKFQIGPAYSSASWQLAYRKGTTQPRDLSQVKDEIVIVNNTESNELLKEYQKELLVQVAEGKITYVIANSIDIASTQHIKPNLSIAFNLTDESDIHWYLVNNSYNVLQAALLNFTHYSTENGLLDNIWEKYLYHLQQFNYVDSRSYIQAIENILPIYQPLFKKYKGDFDWRLLAAVAYQESHWNPDATSPTGVRDIMMLTKDTAQHMKISDRTDPEQSIKAGSEYLHWLISQIPETIEKEERIWFALAAYNMGLGHLIDVRRLTKNLGGNPDNWFDVKKNLPLLAEKCYYSQLKYGYARGYEAHQYVENIRRYMNSIVNYHRVQENQTTNDNVNNESAVKNSEEIKEKKDK